jgi:hypothetical protein
MCPWANFYRRLANEARERAAHATDPSVKDKLEEVAKEWSALAVWAELKQTRQESTSHEVPSGGPPGLGPRSSERRS